jgi:hypothetical protein
VTVTPSDTSKGNDIRNAAIAALKTKLGTEPKNVADHIMLCLPPGTGGWIAYGELNNQDFFWCCVLTVLLKGFCAVHIPFDFVSTS